MYVRMVTITSDPSQVDEVVARIQQGVAPAAESKPGHLGGMLFMNKERGLAVGTTYWESQDAMETSNRALKSVREEAAREGGMIIEQFEVMLAKARSATPEGGRLRLTRVELEAGQREAWMEFYHGTALPDLVAQEGLCSAQMFFDQATNQVVGISTWRDQAALDAGRNRGAGVRAEGLTKLPVVGQPVIEEFTVINFRGELEPL